MRGRCCQGDADEHFNVMHFHCISWDKSPPAFCDDRPDHSGTGSVEQNLMFPLLGVRKE